MTPTRAADALVREVRRVRAEERAGREAESASLFAVFGGATEAPEFMGLVTVRQVARFPARIFADLLPKGPAPRVSAEASAEEVVAALDAGGVEALAVVESSGAFVGAVTRESVLEALLGRERVAQETVLRREAQLRALLRAMPDPVIFLDAEGVCREVFDEERVFAGVPAGLLVGRSVRDLLPREFSAALDRCAEAGELACATLRVLCGRAARAYEVRVAPAPRGFVCIARDATQLHELRAHAVFADRMAAMGTVAAGIAHEINNPLTYMQINVDAARRMLREGRGDELSGRVLDLLGGVAEGVSRIRAIVHDLRGFSRWEDEGASTPVDVEPVLSSALNMAMPHIRPKARLVLEVDRVPPVSGKEARLCQVFLNILVNAAQAIPEGAAEDNEIRVSVREEGRAVHVAVSDTGSGLDGDAKGRLFEPFFTTKRAGEGTGLGLFVSRRIVAELGGRILVEDNPTGGCTFRVVLPVSAPAALESVPAPSRTRARARPARLLFVDDEPAIVAAAPLLLAPHEVVVAGGGRAALRVLEQQAGAIDAVISDLLMPDMSGMDLYAAVRERWPDLAPRFLFLTAGSYTEGARAFVDSVRQPVLEKPAEREAVLRAVDELLVPGRARTA